MDFHDFACHYTATPWRNDRGMLMVYGRMFCWDAKRDKTFPRNTQTFRDVLDYLRDGNADRTTLIGARFAWWLYQKELWKLEKSNTQNEVQCTLNSLNAVVSN